ncbi:hypothetical protein ACX3O0_02160 [Homoserinimonas sp. A447]
MTFASVLRQWGPLALGFALLIIGFIIASQPLTFGWFGYPDGAFARFSPTLVAMPTDAALALSAGIALIAGWLGFRLGNRSGRDR